MNNSKQAIKYFLYVRKSSESEDRQVQSIDDQIAHLTKLASREGLQVVCQFVESKSAKEPYVRPVFMDMMQRIQHGEANGILCWELNRLSRNPVDSGQLDWLKQRGVIQCIQTIDRKYLPEDNVLLFGIESSMANQFIIDLRKNCKRGMEGKAERGWLPSKAPLGYLNNKAENTIVADKERFHLVRKMWDLMLSGAYSPQQILRMANEEWGFRTPKSKREGGSPMSVCTIYKLLSNPFYAGVFKWAGKEYIGKHKSMITLDEFDKVQHLLGKRGNPRAKVYDFAFTGMIRCGACGSMITAEEKSKFNFASGQIKKYIYYRCTRKNKKIPCKGQKPVRLEDLERKICNEIFSISIKPLIKDWVFEMLNEDSQAAATEREMLKSTIMQSITRTQNELDNLTRMSYRELIDEETYLRERNALSGQLIRLKSTLEPSTNTQEYWNNETRKVFEFAAEAQSSFLESSTKEKKRLLAGLGSNFTLKDKELLLDKHEWFITIKKTYEELEEEFDWIELQKSLIRTGVKSDFAPIFIRLRDLIDVVRNLLRNRQARGDPISHFLPLSDAA